MFCNNCSSRLSEGDKVCPVCGTAVGGRYAPPVTPHTPPETSYVPPVNPHVPPAPPYTPPVNTYVPKKQDSPVKTLFTVLLSIVIFFVGSATAGLAITRLFVGSGLTDSIIENIDLAEMANIDEEDFGEELHIDEFEEVGKKITKKVVNQFIDYMLGGDEPKGISEEDIEEILSLYGDELGDSAESEAVEGLLSTWGEMAFEMAFDELRDSPDWEMVESIRNVFSMKTLLTFAAILLVLILLLAIIQRSVGGTMKAVGIVSIIMSVQYIILFAASSVLGNMAVSYVEEEAVVPIIMEIFSRMTFVFIIFGAGLLVGGIVFTAVGSSLKKRKNSMLR